MMKIAYDFHIHTAASPCADEYMSPNNIVNMAKLKGLNAIAITDHHTCMNCGPVMEIGKREGLIVIPGMEIECMEEFHCVALFQNLASAQEMEEYIKTHLLPMKNRIDIFGHQHILNEQDEVIGEIPWLLLSAAQLPAKQIFEKVHALNGVIYPAHIDRNSYSILSNLGFIPDELQVYAVEISKSVQKEYYKKIYSNYCIIQSSDAHYLQDIAEATNHFTIETYSIQGVFDKIIQNKR